MAKKATTIASSEILEPRIYEIGYLLSPAIREEDLEARVSEFKESLTSLDASIISEGNPEFIDIAYEMSKVIENKRVRFNQAYFGWVKIEMDPAKMTELKEVLDKNLLLIRYLLISTVRENTVLSKRPLGKILKGERSELTDESSDGITEEKETGEVPASDDVINDSEEVVENLDEVLDAEIKESVKEA